MVRGCIITKICVETYEADKAGKSVKGNFDKWYPNAGLINCKDCRFKYGSEKCIKYREPLLGNVKPYAKVINT